MKRVPGLDLPIHSIFCIGRNYAEHARELGNTLPDEPVVFLKPLSAICSSGTTVRIPNWVGRVDHEVELVVAISKSGKNIPEDEALSYVGGYGIGLDLTARDIQNKAKQKLLPWTVAKGFDDFAPIGNFVGSGSFPLEQSLNPSHFELKLEIDGKTLQVGRTQDMQFSVPKIISYLSNIFTLNPGDLIFTGTPSGVGPIEDGAHLVAALSGSDQGDQKERKILSGLEITVCRT